MKYLNNPQKLWTTDNHSQMKPCFIDSPSSTVMYFILKGNDLMPWAGHLWSTVSLFTLSNITSVIRLAFVDCLNKPTPVVSTSLSSVLRIYSVVPFTNKERGCTVHAQPPRRLETEIIWPWEPCFCLTIVQEEVHSSSPMCALSIYPLVFLFA